MAVSLAVLRYFKWLRDIAWNLGQGTFKALEMAPFDRSYTTSYGSDIDSASALSCTIFELFGVTLKSGLELIQGHWK